MSDIFNKIEEVEADIPVFVSTSTFFNLKASDKLSKEVLEEINKSDPNPDEVEKILKGNSYEI